MESAQDPPSVYVFPPQGASQPPAGHQVPGLRGRYGKVGRVGLCNPVPNTRPPLTRRGSRARGGWREPGCASASCLVVVNAAHAAPGAGCGLSEPITSLPLPNARGSMNLRQVSPWLPPIQRWMGVKEGGRQIGSANPGAQHGNPAPISHPRSPRSVPGSAHAAPLLSRGGYKGRGGEGSRLASPQPPARAGSPLELTPSCPNRRGEPDYSPGHCPMCMCMRVCVCTCACTCVCVHVYVCGGGLALGKYDRPTSRFPR